MASTLKVDEIKEKTQGSGITLGHALKNSSGTEIMSAAGVFSSNIDGGTIQNATLDSSVTFPAGTVIQTQNYAYTADDYYITSTNSNSFTVFSNGSTNFEYSITPKFSTSKILVQIMAGISKSAGSAHIALYRDDVKLDAATGDQAGTSRLRSTAVVRPNADGTHLLYGAENVFIQYLDSPTIPSTPTSIKYDIRACLGSSYSGTIYLNRSSFNTDINYSARTISTIILQEIAQ